jgi:hypothetical protein
MWVIAVLVSTCLGCGEPVAANARAVAVVMEGLELGRLEVKIDQMNAELDELKRETAKGRILEFAR